MSDLATIDLGTDLRQVPGVGSTRKIDGAVWMLVAVAVSSRDGHAWGSLERVKHCTACEKGWINEAALSCLACHLEATT